MRVKSIAQRLIGRIALLCLLLMPGLASASLYNVSIDTSSYSGTVAQMAFDFIDGGSPSNTVTISGFSTTGVLGGSSALGGVTGTLPAAVSLTDTEFFNEYLNGITLGTGISFTVALTSNAPESGSSPDAFSFFLLDPSKLSEEGFPLPLFATSDSTGADALFQIDITGSLEGAVGNFHQDVSITEATPVPEPGTFLLLASGLAGSFIFRRRAKHV